MVLRNKIFFGIEDFVMNNSDRSSTQIHNLQSVGLARSVEVKTRDDQQPDYHKLGLPGNESSPTEVNCGKYIKKNGENYHA